MKYLIFTLITLWSIGLYSQSVDSIDFKSCNNVNYFFTDCMWRLYLLAKWR